MVSRCPYTETDTTKIPTSILEINRKYLSERVGAEFYSKLHYYSCQVIDFSKYREIKKSKPWIDKKNADKRAKYAIQYYFLVQDSMRYYLSVVYDKNGKLISEHFLPEKQTNQSFDKIIDVCTAVKITEADSVFIGEATSISLEYMPSENAFVWIIRKPDVDEGNNSFHRYIILNAVTGKLVKRKTEKYIIVCRLPSF